MNLLTAFLIYCGVLAIFGISIKFFSFDFNFVLYFILGFLLNRFVLRRLNIKFNPIHRTLENVSSFKWRMFLLWPVAWLWLFLNTFIIRVL